MELKICRPYIINMHDKSRLCADIIINSTDTRTLYYEVNKEYEPYLCTERSDAFLLSLLQFAMNQGLNITWEAPVTERLIYQLRTMYIPVMSDTIPEQFHFINLAGPITNEKLEKENKYVATGGSGGVDSFYTLISHTYEIEPSFKLTHMLYVAISNNVASTDELRKDFEDGCNNITGIAQEMNLPVVTLFSNEAEFFFEGIVDGGALRYAGMVYALQKLFSVYYLSSGYHYADQKIKKGSSAHYDLFNLSSVSTDSLQFYSTGAEVGREEKTHYIEKYEVVKKHLHVCNFDDINNCSECDKCFRTMLTLYADNYLHEYQNVFDLQKFEKLKNKYIARMVYRQSTYDKEVMRAFSCNKIAIPVSAKIRGYILRPCYVLWQEIQKIPFLMKLFYKTNLDYALYGKELADSIRYSNGIEKVNRSI